MKQVSPLHRVIMGIDVSHWQPNIHWPSVKAYGVDFCFVKASEHIFADVKFKSHWQGLADVKIPRGAYHFFHPAQDPVQQANFFCDTIGTLSPEDMSPVMDWESTDGLPWQKDLDSGLAFLNQVELRTGRVPIIYGGPYFFLALKLSPYFKRFPLWIAHYGTKAPLVPPPWETWAFWQKTDSGGIHGINGHVDVDVFNGSKVDLERFISGLPS